MPDIEVGPQSLRDAAKGSRELAGDARGVDPSMVERITQAMPDSGPALNAYRVSDYWAAKLRRLASALDDRADKLTSIAAEYESGERDKARDFDARIPEK